MTGFFREDITRRELAVLTGATLIGFMQADAGAVARTTQNKLRDLVSVVDFGADPTGAIDSTTAFAKCSASGATRVFFPQGRYKVTLIVGHGLFEFVDKVGIELVGAGAVFDNTAQTHAAQAAYTSVFSFERCKGLNVRGISYEGEELPSPSHSVDGVGYAGAIFVRLKDHCSNVNVKASLNNLRYGVVGGDYVDPTLGYNSNIHVELKTYKCGYPIALYLADNVTGSIDAKNSHRATYLAGVINTKLSIQVRNNYIAGILNLLTDAKTGTSTSRGCENIELKIRDDGSTVYVENAYLAGINPSRGDPVEFNNIDVVVALKATSMVATTLGIFTVSSSYRSVQPSYIYNWYPHHKLKNITISGIVDKSALTTEYGNLYGDVYIKSFDDASIPATPSYATVAGLTFELQMPRSASYTTAHAGLVIRLGASLVGLCTFKNCNFYTHRMYLVGNSTTGKIVFDNCKLYSSNYLESYDASTVSFIKTKILDPGGQPRTNKTFIN